MFKDKGSLKKLKVTKILFFFITFLFLFSGIAFAENVVSFLGKSLDDKNIKSFMDGLNEEPIVRKDYITSGYTLYIYRMNGINLGFKDGVLYDIAIDSRFKKEANLPGDINFLDSRESINKKLGNPTEAYDDLKVKGTKLPVFEIWKHPDYTIRITYSKATGKMSSFSISK